MDRIDYLLQLLCDERLEEREAVELAELLATSESARRRYVEAVQLCVTLADPSPSEDSAAAMSESVCVAPASNGRSAVMRSVRDFGAKQVKLASRPLISPVWWRPFEAVRGRYRRPFMAVAVMLLLSIGFWGSSYFRDEGRTPSAGLGGNRAAVGRSDQSNDPRQASLGSYVARVVEVTTDARWAVDRQPREFLMRLRAGDQLHLVSGLAHLEFYSGARIILQGPSKFTPTGTDAGKLETGRLTGKVDGGKFWLTTPTAKVIDLGTEFGVTVGPTSDTDVCVFDGEVQVRPGLDGLDNHQQPPPSYHLIQGMSVRVAATGTVSDGMYVGVEYDAYTRSFPLPASTNPDELDLVDIVCGGNGQGARLAAAIDPLTGQWDRRPWNNSRGPGTRHGDQLFHPASWHPYIDGTFVPNQYGKPFQVDSRGGTIVLPENRGHYTWGPIWARRAVNDTAHLDHSADSWGAMTYPVITERLTRCRLGGIGIHASVGITFDLQTIGNNHAGRIRRLKGVLVNLENSKEHNPEWASENPAPTADFRIYVDAQPRHETLDFARNVAGVPFAIDLSPSDRFLTLITTDGGNSNRYDHLVIIDPVLEIDHADEKAE
jgi:hypothetical protein